MIFHFKAIQKTWLQTTMKEIMTWFSPLARLKNLVAEQHKRDFDMIFYLK